MKNKIKILELKTKKILNSGLFGNYKSKFTGDAIEFFEHKQYNFGDNIRDIDWKASAKTNFIQIKKYEQEKDLNVFFVLDNSFSMEFGSIEKTKKDLLEEIFFVLSFSAYYSNDSIGALIFDENNLEFVEQKKSKNNIYEIFKKLNFYSNFPKKQKKQKIDLSKVLKNIIDRKIKNNLIFILTDKIQDFNYKDLMLISNQNDLVFINIFDILENLSQDNLSFGEKNDIFGNLTIESGNTFLNIDLKNKNKITEFQEYRKDKLQKLKYNLEKNNIGYLKFETTQDIYKELFNFFNQK